MTASEQEEATSVPPAMATRLLARRPDVALLMLGGSGLLAAALIRLALLPTGGYPFDLDQFVLWAHQLAAAPLGEAYRIGLPYPPVMVYVLAGLGALDPVFRTATAGGSAVVDVAIKLPATLADIGLASCVAYALRERPRWAVYGALAILLNPALWYLSAWWGQTDSLYVLPALIGYLLAVSGRPLPAAVALAVSVMTKPQALVFVVPFVAWSLARYGLRTTSAAGAAFLAAAAVLWLPFLPDGGPADFVHALTTLQQGSFFSYISFGAWNPWWIVQRLAGHLIADSNHLAGSVTLSSVCYALAGLAELLVFVLTFRRPSLRGLALGLACATLLAFELLPGMHERYALAAIAFLAVLLPEARIRALWMWLTVVMTADMMAAVPATLPIGAVLPANGAVTIAGSLAMIGLTLWCLLLLVHEPVSARVGARP